MNELEITDFSFDGEYGSQGTTIEKIGRNHFAVKMGHAPSLPDFNNQLQFIINDNAKGNDLRLDVSFHRAQYSFNSYFTSWSYDNENWIPALWEMGFRNNHPNQPVHDTVYFPEFEQNTVYFGAQVPLSYEVMLKLLTKFAESPLAELHKIGESIEKRGIYRLSINDPESDNTSKKAHYIGCQHPLEHNAQWRSIGMIDWLLTENSTEFLKYNICHFVIKICPDGTANGWHSVNAEGQDVQRSYYLEGVSKDYETAIESLIAQKDLEKLAEQNTLETVWAMHTWEGVVETMLIQNDVWQKNHIGEKFRKILLKNSTRGLLKPLKILRNVLDVIDEETYRKNRENYRASLWLVPDEKFRTWGFGPYKQFNVSAFLCEGNGSIYTKEDNLESGRIIMKSLAELYHNK